jgi:hypothetical protein
MTPLRRNHAIDRSKLAHKAKPLGDLIIEAMHKKMDGMEDVLASTLPPIPVVKRKRKRRAKADREAPVVHDCLKWLHDHGVFCWRNNTGTAWIGTQPVVFGYPGSGDIIGLTPRGQFFVVECKSPTGTQSPKQKEFEAKVRANSGIYILVRSVEELACGIQPYLSSGRSTTGTTSTIGG